MRERILSLLAVVAISAAACGGASRVGTSLTPTRSHSVSPLSTSSPSPTLVIHVPPIPDGVYETTINRADARRLGFTRCDPQDVDENTGHVVMTLRAGRYRQVQSANHPIIQPIHTGVYTGTRTIVTFIANPNTAGEGTTTATWRFDGKRLSFKVLKATDAGGQTLPLCIARLGLEAHPWKKIG